MGNHRGKKRGNRQSGIRRINGGDAYVRSGVIHFNFNDGLKEIFKSAKVMSYSSKLLKINPRINPHSYYIGRTIDINYRLNEGKNRLETITIETLIKRCPLLPNYSDVVKGNRHVYDRIIGPFFRDLDALEIPYNVIDKKGNEIDAVDMDYETFINARIIIDYSGYPTSSERIAARQQHLADKTKNCKPKDATNKPQNSTYKPPTQG